MTRPEILTHPNIPKPLHGMNPRTLLGKAWWDEKRQEAYKAHGYHCWACGVHKSNAKYHKWLEGHENYQIDYKTGRVDLIEVVALCHSCHNFIHSGRLWILLQKGEHSMSKVKDILLHGFMVLKDSGLKPWYGTAAIWLMLEGMTRKEAIHEVESRGIQVLTKADTCDWEEWHLVIDGQKFFTKYENIDAWAEAYA